MKTFNFRLLPDQKKKLKVEAAKRDLTIKSLLLKSFEEYIKRNPETAGN